jgi:hypothetical protein
VIGYVVGGIGVASIAIAVLLYYVRPAGQIWRGDTSQVPPFHYYVLEVSLRTYPTFLLCVGALTLGFTLGGIAVALRGITGADWPQRLLLAGLIMLLASAVLMPLNWFVAATGRPRFLVPPSYRDQPASFAAARSRRQRKRAGLPQADHLVEIVKVRPEPGDDSESYFVAICAHDGCGWMEFADDDILEQSEEEQLRAKTARHSTNVAREVQHRP